MSKKIQHTTRYDRGIIEPISYGDGFMRAKVTIARAGVFPYVTHDGKIRKEAKLPDDLFSRATIDSAKGAPITDGHPPRSDSKGMVTPANYQKYAKGSLGDTATIENDHLVFFETVYDEALIADTKSKKKVEVSIGFTTAVDETPGEFRGERYDARQTNIKINHLAHVENGRGGDTVRVHLDASDGDIAVMMDEAQNSTDEPDTGNAHTKEKSMDENALLGVFKKFFEWLKGEAEKTPPPEDPNPPVKPTEPEPAKEPPKHDSAEVIKLQARIDALEATLAKNKADKDTAVKLDEAISERIQLVDSARGVIQDYKHDGKTDREIKLDVIDKVLPYDKSVKVDELDAVFIDARYDAAMSLAREKALDGDNHTSSAPRLDEAAIQEKKNKRNNIRGDK